MRYGSVYSGIEAATAAWHPLGWEPVWFSEIAPFPCRVLQHHYPHVPNLGDMLLLLENPVFQHESIDLLVGGTPCQSFSLAGLRKGLSDERGNLALQFCRILAAKRPRWFIWENVPGVFSSRGGRDLACILRGFRGCGYSVSWRVLDAQFFGVPQRRRRVFVVGYLGDDWRPPAAVLFEPESLRRDPAEGGGEGEEVTGTLGRRTGGRSIGAEEAGGNMLVSGTIDAAAGRSRGAGTHPGLITGTIDASYGRLQGASGQDACHGHSTLVTSPPLTCRPYADNESRESALIIQNPENRTCGHWIMATDQGKSEILADLAPTLNCNHEQPIYFETRVGRYGRGGPDDVAAPLKAQSGQTGKGDGAPCIFWSIMPMNSSKDYKAREVEVTQPISTQMGISHDQGGDIIQSGPVIRRLTPTECERLQGFPDGYTAIPGAADSPRYEAIGNSMARPVMEWLGRRIDIVDKMEFQ